MKCRMVGGLVLFALLLGGCSYVKQPNDKKMKKLLSGMPEYSAGEAFGKRDFRFLIVIDGEQTTQPDVPACLVTRFGTKSLSNTSYEAGSYAYDKYAAVARVYAKYFNAALLASLKTRNWDKCEGKVPVAES